MSSNWKSRTAAHAAEDERPHHHPACRSAPKGWFAFGIALLIFDPVSNPFIAICSHRVRKAPLRPGYAVARDPLCSLWRMLFVFYHGVLNECFVYRVFFLRKKKKNRNMEIFRRSKTKAGLDAISYKKTLACLGLWVRVIDTAWFSGTKAKIKRR